ncbi:MAG: hypothetical protein CM1200mP22_04600 [Dehalococcoidia bacterium]|nr:MAG: hypothetical protein CM1200mP22_04600 [Dehalococcoidia bacterium]
METIDIKEKIDFANAEALNRIVAAIRYWWTSDQPARSFPSWKTEWCCIPALRELGTHERREKRSVIAIVIFEGWANDIASAEQLLAAVA